MSHNNPSSQNRSLVKEEHVLEPETSCEDKDVKQSQSGRKINKNTRSLRKCQSVDGPLGKRKRSICRLKTPMLTVPQVSEKLISLVNILQHENFLKVVDQFFKPTTGKQPRKKSQQKKFIVAETSTRKPAIANSFDFNSNTL